MNIAHLQELSPADRAFAELAQRRLRDSESLNYVESARLAAARAQAVALLRESHGNPRHWGWLAAPAALAVITVVLLRFETADTLVTPAAGPAPSIEVSADVNATTPDALVWLSDEAGPDFYRDLEFYQWLQSRSPTEPNA